MIPFEASSHYFNPYLTGLSLSYHAECNKQAGNPTARDFLFKFYFPMTVAGATFLVAEGDLNDSPVTYPVARPSHAQIQFYAVRTFWALQTTATTRS